MKLEFWKGAYPEAETCQKRREISEFETKEEMWTLIKKFMDDHHFKSYYQRIWIEEETDTLWIDVGSHTEFFVVQNPTKNLIESYFKR